jgi:hypothetical protein
VAIHARVLPRRFQQFSLPCSRWRQGEPGIALAQALEHELQQNATASCGLLACLYLSEKQYMPKALATALNKSKKKKRFFFLDLLRMEAEVLTVCCFFWGGSG